MSAAPLIPPVRRTSALAALVALATLLALLATAAALALTPAAFALDSGVAQRASVQLTGPRESRAADVQRAVAALSSAPGVRRVTAVAERESAALVTRWLGGVETLGDVTLPSLIDVEMAPGARAEAISAALVQAVPAARLTPAATWLGPVAGLMRAIGVGAALTALALVGAAAATSALSVRGVLARERQTIATLHLVGATDVQVARLFTRAVMDAIGAGVLAGTAIALLLLLALQPLFEASAGGLALGGESALTWRWFSLAIPPLLIAVAGALAARQAVLRELRGMP